MSNEIRFAFPTNPLAKGVFSLFKKFSYFLIPDWRLRELFLSSYLIKLFERYQIESVLDVGANTGQFGKYLREQVGFKGRILSIEPASGCIPELKRVAARFGNWEVLQCGVSERKETRVLHLTQASVLSSFRDPAAKMHPDYVKGMTAVGEEQVECLPLGEIVRDSGVNLAHCFLKSDTQGFDPEVINSLGELISELPCAMAEVSVQRYYEDCMLYTEFIALMEGKGFDLGYLHPVTLDKKLKVVEFDAIFLKRG